MHRLADFQHHIVADVHQRRNAANAAALEPLAHPRGRGGLRVDIFNHTADKAAAVGRRIDAHRLGFAAANRGRLNHRRRKTAAGQRRHFAGNALDAQTIGAVGRDFQRKQRVVQIQIIADVRTDGRIGRQDMQAVHAVVGQAQLFGGTQHSVRFHSAHLGQLDFKIARQHRARQRTGHLNARPHIRRTADNLHQLARTRINLGNVQTVGIRMFFNGFHLRHHHARKRRRSRLALFHFQTGHGQQVRKLIGRTIRIGLGFEPGIGELHGFARFKIMKNVFVDLV